MVSWERDNGITLREIDSRRGPVLRRLGNCRAPDSFYRNSKKVDFAMDPYAKPTERKVGAQRPKITHLPKSLEKRTRRERQAEKQTVAVERRAIKKSARRHLKKELLAELEDAD